VATYFHQFEEHVVKMSGNVRHCNVSISLGFIRCHHTQDCLTTTNNHQSTA